jgi:hypothetical protein
MTRTMTVGAALDAAHAFMLRVERALRVFNAYKRSSNLECRSIVETILRREMTVSEAVPLLLRLRPNPPMRERPGRPIGPHPVLAEGARKAAARVLAEYGPGVSMQLLAEEVRKAEGLPEEKTDTVRRRLVRHEQKSGQKYLT